MKNGIYICLLSLLVLACKGNKNTDTNGTPPLSISDSIQQSFLHEQEEKIENWQKNLKGTWYNQEYFEQLDFLRSPFKLFGESPDIVGFNVDKKIVFSDKKITLPAFNIHEGGFTVQFIRKENQIFFSTNLDPKLQFKVIEISENELLLEHPTNGEVFSYARKDNFGRAIEEQLIVGNYEIMETGKRVRFDINGVVAGIPEYTNYEIPYDYVGLADFDVLLLTKVKKPTIDDYTMYKAVFGPQEIVLTKYIADWTNLDHQETKEIIHLRKK